ncbi:MAG: hypothetical protein HW396_1697, partial [Candidatus Dadabacteria bacterium]|nr:hypothetical protein [Candidatus Dadabacteria bacterium]
LKKTGKIKVEIETGRLSFYALKTSSTNKTKSILTQ